MRHSCTYTAFSSQFWADVVERREDIRSVGVVPYDVTNLPDFPKSAEASEFASDDMLALYPDEGICHLL